MQSLLVAEVGNTSIALHDWYLTMTDAPLKKMQELEEAMREAQRLLPAETVVFVPPQPVWQPFQQPEAAPPLRVQWQPSRRPEYKWGEPERG